MALLIKSTVCKPDIILMPGRKYWPCAPDGFIPNSVIRDLITPKKPTFNSVKPWKPRPVKALVERSEVVVMSFHEHEEGWCDGLFIMFHVKDLFNFKSENY